MAKRVSQDERPYRPVEEALVRAVMHHEEAELGVETVETEGSQRTNGPSKAAPDELVVAHLLRGEL